MRVIIRPARYCACKIASISLMRASRAMRQKTAPLLRLWRRLICRAPCQKRCCTGIWAARLIYAGIGTQVRKQGYDSISMRARTGTAQKLGWLMQAGLRSAGSLVMPTSAVIYAKPLDEVRFLVDAAARQGVTVGRSPAVLDILAELKARDMAGMG